MPRRAPCVAVVICWISIAQMRAQMPAADALAPFHRPSKPLTVTLWTNTSGGFTYPELTDGAFGIPALRSKLSLGVAHGCGGARAACLTMGTMRALYALDIMKDVSHTACASGGCWAAAPHTYTQRPGQQLLGAYTPPEDLTVDKVLAVDPEALQGPLQLLNLLNVFTTPYGASDMGKWTRYLAGALLAPFGLSDIASTTCASGTLGDICRWTRQRLGASVTVYENPTDRPFLVMLASLTRKVSNRTVFFPFEWTPLYSGVAAVHNPDARRPVGGGLVETLGVNSMAPLSGRGPSPPGGKNVTLWPKTILPLASQSGSSSNSIPASLQARERLPAVVPVETAGLQDTTTYFDLWRYQTTAGQTLTDAGPPGCTAIHSLLRRGLRGAILDTFWPQPLLDSAEQFAASITNVAGLFGAVPAGGMGDFAQPAALFNQQLQVFPTEAWAPLWQELKRLQGEGKPTIVHRKLRVLPNAFQGIDGGYEAEVLISIPTDSGTWEARLPADTQAWLARRRAETAPLPDTSPVNRLRNAVNSVNGRTCYRDFPRISTYISQLQPGIVNMLSQWQTWRLLQSEATIRGFMAAVKAANSAGR